jgi:hypothetical protein
LRSTGKKCHARSSINTSATIRELVEGLEANALVRLLAVTPDAFLGVDPDAEEPPEPDPRPRRTGKK